MGEVESTFAEIMGIQYCKPKFGPDHGGPWMPIWRTRLLKYEHWKQGAIENILTWKCDA